MPAALNGNDADPLHASVAKAIGSKETLERAYGLKAGSLSDDNYNQVVAQATAACGEKGMTTPEAVEHWRRKGTRDDFWHRTLNYGWGFGSSYGVVFALVLAAPYLLPFLTGIQVALVWLAGGVGGMAMYGAHALKASMQSLGEMDKEKRPDGGVRSRYTKAPNSKTFKGALLREYKAQWPSILFGTGAIVALKLLVAFVFPPLAPFVEFLLFFGTAIVFGVGMAAFSGARRERMRKPCNAPQFGIDVEKTPDGQARLVFNREQFLANHARLDQSPGHKSLTAVGRSFGFIGKHFGKKYSTCREKGLQKDDVVEVVCGGALGGGLAMVGAAWAGTAFNWGPTTSALVSAGRSAAISGGVTTLGTNPLTAGDVARQVPCLRIAHTAHAAPLPPGGPRISAPPTRAAELNR